MTLLLIYLVAAIALVWVLAGVRTGRGIGTGALLAALGLAVASGLMPMLVFDHETYLGDLWVAFEAANKSAGGLASSRDYFSPIGPVYDWAFRLAVGLRPLSATTVPLASALVASGALVFGFLLLGRRLDFPVLGVALLIAVATIVSPREPDTILAETSISWLAPYNRWAGGGAVLLTLGLATPRGRSGWIEACLLGVGIAVLGLIKVTYGAALTGLLVVALVVGTLRPGHAVLALLAAGATLAGLEIWSGQILAYGRDILFAAGLQSSGLRVFDLLAQMGEALAWAVFALILLAAGSAGGRNLVRGGAMIVIVAGMGWVILMQNHWRSESALYAILPLLAAQWAGLFRSGRDDEPPEGRGALRVLVLGAALIYPVQDGATVLVPHVQALRFSPDPALAGTPQADFLLHRRWFAFRDTPAKSPMNDYDRMIAGAAALRELGADKPEAGAVLALGFSNPFPMLLGKPSPARSPIWLHVDRTFSEARHLPAKTLFSGVEFLMLAKGDPNAAALWDIYRRDIEGGFVEVGDTEHWVIYRRH